MSVAAQRIEAIEEPAMWVCEQTGLAMHQIEVPFKGVRGSWDKNLLAAAPRLHLKNRVLEWGKYFDKPAAPASKTFTLLLGNRWDISSAKWAVEFAKSRPIWPASPYHVFEAIKHVGGFNNLSWWENRNGPGVVIPTKAKWRDDIICLWYHNKSDPGGAQVCDFDRNFSLAITPFVTYNWKAQK